MELSATRKIEAPLDRVFAFVSSVPAMSKAFPDQVIKIVPLSENETGLGARFREHRLLGKKEDVIELETIDYVLNERVATETLTGGSLWRTKFAVEPDGDATVVTMTMEALPQNIFGRILNIFLKPALKKGTVEELDKVKAHCERADFLA